MATGSYSMTKPCPECPFRRDGTDGTPNVTPVRLTRSRVREIAGLMLNPNGGEFPCHKTTGVDGEGQRCRTRDSIHCAGALIFAEKNGVATQMMRIAGRLGLYDPDKLDKASFAEVFDDMPEMLATALDARRGRR